MDTKLKYLAMAIGLPMLAACGGSDSSSPEPEYSLSGAVSGLKGSVTIKANESSLTVAANGTFTFSGKYKSGTAVGLTVTAQPLGQQCAFASPSVTVNNANISNLAVSCTDLNYTVSGSASGVTSPVRLSYVVAGSPAVEKVLSGNGDFVVAENFTYNNSVSLSVTSDETLSCEVTPASLTVTANVANVAVQCVPRYRISGVATGMVRPISLEYDIEAGTASQIALQQISAGNFAFPNTLKAGTQVRFTAYNDIGHTCSVTPQTATLNADLTNLQVNCVTFGQINGQVNAYDNGAAIANAKLEVYVDTQSETPRLLQVVSSDDDGRFVVNATGYSERVSVKASAPDFVTRADVVRIAETNPETNMAIALLRVGFKETFASNTEKTIVLPDSALRIALPANAFVTAQGALYNGEVTAAVTNIDASSDPAIMPGYYIAYDPVLAREQVFESFGALNAVFAGSNGEALQLGENVQADIRIPLAVRAANPPATIPLIHFDESRGIWLVEGSATLERDEQNRPYYAGLVNHFSTWNADVLFDSVNILGCALDNQTQQGIPGLRVQADGVNYIGRSIAYTDVNGQFSIAVRPNSEVLLSVRDAEGQSSTSRVSVFNTDLELDDCITTDIGAMVVTLTWGQNPRDLDTHFKGPRFANSLTDRFHLYFGRPLVTIENVTMYLDVDDTTSFGPEILTVPRFPVAGRYIYSVHHYAGSGTIFQSPTRVEVLINGMSYVFSPSQDADTVSATNTWQVFEIEVSDSGAARLIPLNRYSSLSSNDVSGVSSIATLSTAEGISKKVNSQSSQ